MVSEESTADVKRTPVPRLLAVASGPPLVLRLHSPDGGQGAPDLVQPPHVVPSRLYLVGVVDLLAGSAGGRTRQRQKEGELYPPLRRRHAGRAYRRQGVRHLLAGEVLHGISTEMGLRRCKEV